MKKLIALLLALMMALGVACAVAEDDWEAKDLYNDKGEYIGYEEYYNGVLESRHERDLETNTVTDTYYDGNGNVSSYSVTGYDDNGNSTGSVTYDANNQVIRKTTGQADEDSYEYTTCYYENGEATWINVWGGDENGDYDLSFNMDGSINEDSPWESSTTTEYYDKETGKWYSKETGAEVAAPDLSSIYAAAKSTMLKKPVWYYHNTVSVAGISLRDAYPGLTDKWYNVVPVDLSQDGTQQFPLVVSNMYYIGTVTVTVAGDEVTASYRYSPRSNYHFSALDDCLAWFTGVDQITGDFLENPNSNMSFGQKISKANDLNGQDVALLFVCNHVTYRVPFTDDGITPKRFYRDSRLNADYFNGLNSLMTRLGN